MRFNDKKTQKVHDDLRHHAGLWYFNQLTALGYPSSMSKWVLNSMWFSDSTWRHRSGSTMFQIMVGAWWHQAISWTNVDLSSVGSHGLYMRAVSWEMVRISIHPMNLKMAHSKLLGVRIFFTASLPDSFLNTTSNIKGVCAISLVKF